MCACVVVVTMYVIERLSLSFLASRLKFRPTTRKAHKTWTSDDGCYDYVRHAVVTRGIGKIVNGWDDEFGFQHCIVLWGPLKYLPAWFTNKFMYQRTVFKSKGLFDANRQQKLESVSIFPCTQVHLVGFRTMYLNELIDFTACQIVEIYAAGTKNGATGARDLRMWSHHNCPWMLPPAPEDLEPQRITTTTPEDPAPAAS